MKTSKSTILLTLAVLFLVSCNPEWPSNPIKEKHKAVIFPDYTSLIIPVNIAPLNFVIKEEANSYLAKFSNSFGKEILLESGNGKIIIPGKEWRKLIKESINDSIKIEIAIKRNNDWHTFPAVSNYVSPDSIDPYIVFRKINPALILWNDMSINQRSTESFEESAILENRNTGGNCMHCHTYQSHDPENFMLHLRAPGGTYIKSGEIQRWLDTKTNYTIASFAYPAWHPTKKIIAFSTNRIQQAMYSSGEHLNAVYDDVSDIVLYDIVNNEVFTSPKLASEDLENLPEWSSDGKYLYYINCPIARKQRMGKLVKYDLMRIAYDPELRNWGNPELLISSDSAGFSISFPKVSNDGNHLIFCAADIGYFTITNPTTDLYIMDLRTKSYRELCINSTKTESFHDWSLNSKWIVFASKRGDGIITLPYFSHIDENGKESKPFVMPVEDPESLVTSLFNYNRPVFVNGKTSISESDILEEISKPVTKVIFDSIHVYVDSLAAIKGVGDKAETSIYQRK